MTKECIKELQELEAQRKKEVEDEAAKIGLNLNYEPEVQMEDIRLLPDSFWHKSRQTGWGGSDEGVLRGKNPFTTLEETAYAKLFGITKPVDDGKQYTFDVGHALEPVLLRRYASMNGYKLITYPDYFVIVETNDDVTVKFPQMKKAMNGVYSKVYRDKIDAETLLGSLQKVYPSAYIVEQESNEPKDYRDITEEEKQKYKDTGYVFVDRRQYKHPLYPMLGDCDGVCITPTGEMIGIECKTYSRFKRSSYASGILGEEGAVGNPSYPDQTRHYMAVINKMNRFDILSTCGNADGDISVTTVYRDAEEEQKICNNCKDLWDKIQNNEFPEIPSLSADQYKGWSYTYQRIPENQKKRLDTDEAISNIKKYEELQKSINALDSQMKELVKRQAQCQQNLEKMMDKGDTVFIQNPDNEKSEYKLEYKLKEPRASFNKKQLAANYPGIAANYDIKPKLDPNDDKNYSFSWSLETKEA